MDSDCLLLLRPAAASPTTARPSTLSAVADRWRFDARDDAESQPLATTPFGTPPALPLPVAAATAEAVACLMWDPVSSVSSHADLMWDHAAALVASPPPPSLMRGEYAAPPQSPPSLLPASFESASLLPASLLPASLLRASLLRASLLRASLLPASLDPDPDSISRVEPAS